MAPSVPEDLCPGAVDVLFRKPAYVDLFPIGSSLAQWATST